MPMERPTSREAYIELVNQAMGNAEELRRAIEADEEYVGIAKKLENNIKSLYASLIGGSYEHADEDLDFMDIVDTETDVRLSFKPLLRLINQTHRQGLETG